MSSVTIDCFTRRVFQDLVCVSSGRLYSSQEMRLVTVRVPGSTSNLGSGFDTLGLALKLYTNVCVTATAEKGIAVVSPLARKDNPAAMHLVTEAAGLFFQRTRNEPCGIEVCLKSKVPIARGLGYSSTVRVGVLAALNELTRAGLDRADLLQLATELEGHPDNASPAIFGGFTVSGRIGSRVRCFRSPVSSYVKFITLVPRFTVSTEQARKFMPKIYSRTDAAHALNRSALVTAAFSSGDYAALRGVFDDRMHQPYRERLVPRLNKVVQAGERAGAIGGFLSGSGSSIICVTLKNERAVAKAMQRQLHDSSAIRLSADNEGFRFIKAKRRGP
jgi:homoserine kinase